MAKPKIVYSGRACHAVTAANAEQVRRLRHTELALVGYYPCLEREGVRQALAYTAWRLEEVEIPLTENAAAK